jgi:hypothetical protein
MTWRDIARQTDCTCVVRILLCDDHLFPFALSDGSKAVRKNYFSTVFECFLPDTMQKISLPGMASNKPYRFSDLLVFVSTPQTLPEFAIR